MEQVADGFHLQQRGTRWYYHRRVPAELVSLAGKSVVKQSLSTADRTEAKRRRAILDVETDAWFAAMRKSAGPGLPSTQAGSGKFGNHSNRRIPLEMLLEYIRDSVETSDSASRQQLLADPPRDRDELQELRADAETALEILSDPADDRRLPAIVSFGKQVLKRAAASAPDPADTQAFNELVRRALIELSRRRLSRYEDQHDRDWFDALFNPSRPKSISLRALADAYIEERKIDYRLNGVSDKRFDKVVSHLATIVEIIGPEYPISQVDDETVQKVRQSLANLPSNRTKLYPGLSLEKALHSAKAASAKTLSPTTQQQYLEEFRGLLNLAVRRKFLNSNPAVDVKPLKRDTRPPHARRSPFSAPQLEAYFTSDFYRSCAPNAEAPYEKGDRDWRLWLPLIMLYSSARPNEIAQLRASDVKKSLGGSWYFDLMPESDDAAIQLKTETSRRRIPVHSELLKFGLLQFVADCGAKRGPEAELFPTLKPNKYGNRAWYAAKRINEKFLPEVVELKHDQSLFLDVSSVLDGDYICVVWAETGGPPITEVPVLKGYGSRLTARSVSGQLGGQLDYDWQESGLVVIVRMRQDRLAH